MMTNGVAFPPRPTSSAPGLESPGKPPSGDRKEPRRTVMTRTKPAEQRRAELLAAAQALFLAKGISGTSLDDITQRAGVSKGLFYLYFASKEDLVLALREQFSRDLAERMRAAAEAVPASTLPASGGAGWADRLDACVRAGLERYRDLHDLHEVLFHHAHVSPPGSGSVTSGTVAP